jgi:hypothetical protein
MPLGQKDSQGQGSDKQRRTHFVTPSGTKTWPDFAGILWDQILVALDKNVRAPVVVPRYGP